MRDARRCGLRKAVHPASGAFEWVAAEWAAAYEKHGPLFLLGLSAEELGTLTSK